MIKSAHTTYSTTHITHLFHRYITALFLLLCCFQTIAVPIAKDNTLTPLFWQLEFNGVKSYAFGSIHLGDHSMYPLPPAVMAGFKASQALAVEINVDEQSQPLMTKLSQQYGMDKQRPLSSWLSTTTKKKYADYCQEKALPCQRFSQFKPWLVSVTFASTSFLKSGFDPKLGIDWFFIKQAKKYKKPLIELETAESQFQLFSGLPAHLQEELLLQSMAENVEDFKALIKTWREGNEQKLAALFSEVENPALEKVFIEQMLIKRNHKMAAALLAEFKAGKSLFVVVGAAHFVGEQNILTLLQQKGVKVTKQPQG